MANFYTQLYSMLQKGYLSYEYNPFHNYQTDVDLYILNTNVGKILVPKGKAVDTRNGQILTKKQNKWVNKYGDVVLNTISEAQNGDLYAKAGSLIDLDTDQLDFDLRYPVDITVQPSYDGSVNLILNDDKHIPRLINSRFSPREMNTYEIVDRIGENDTNIYNSKSFDKDTSLYFQFDYNPTVEYNGFVKGILPVGNYCFYFTYCDADNNESDIVAETGIIPVFKGSDMDPSSIDGGIKNELSDKGIKLRLTNVDKSYNYLKIYCLRYFADYQQHRVTECKKLYRKFPINSNILYIQITGNEDYEEIDPNILNLTRFNPKSVLTQAQCKNILFFGNIVKNTDNYRELIDCSLRIIPSLISKDFSALDTDYMPTGGEYGYYDSYNMYNNVGYFDQEYYRFGVVYIYNNGTLSNVYNTLGYDLKNESNEVNIPDCTVPFYETNNGIIYRNYIKIDDLGWIPDGFSNTAHNINSKGVCKINKNIDNSKDEILGIKFNIPKEITKFLKEELGIRGLFFVRQKCIPNIIAQCLLLPMDETLQAPVLKFKKSENDLYYATECFLNHGEEVAVGMRHLFGIIKTTTTVGRLEVTNNYVNRLYLYDEKDKSSISRFQYAAICPDFLLDQPYYNQIFNGNKFKLKQISSGNLYQNGRYYNYSGKNSENLGYQQVSIVSVTQDVTTASIKDKIYRTEIGTAEEAYRFRYAGTDNGTYDAGDADLDSMKNATNLVRGIYSPYLAVYSTSPLDTVATYNIYRDTITDTTQEYQNRMDSSEPFYSISDRFNFEDLISVNDKKIVECWKGDCFINTFTYRLNRNFCDPSLPNNDEIIDSNTWKENYDVTNSEMWERISRSDLNAVQMGSWITFKVRSAMNYALRSEDHSYVSEEALMGSPRSYVPRNWTMYKGENKLPDSYLYNDAFRATLGYKCYFTLDDMNYIKDSFSNRIQYSAISIQDSFKNNYRDSFSTYFRDYSQEYGGITKLVGFENHILVIFEHAIGLAVINERVLAGNGEGEPVFINTQNVLPEELTIITDTYGTQWSESVVKSEQGYVYGVDTVAKKIWRVQGQNIELLSDFKVNKFLIENISLSELEVYPFVGIRNVKTHYNNNKKDIMFTFYDDVYKDEEKVWNLCYNEIIGKFITFYSWLPSYSENIDTQFFTFNREVSKGLSLLSKCNYYNPENYGILLDMPIFNGTGYQATLHYKLPNGEELNQVLFELEKDNWNNYKKFNISYDSTNGKYKLNVIDSNINTNQIYLLQIKVSSTINDSTDGNLAEILGVNDINQILRSETIAITFKDNIINWQDSENFRKDMESMNPYDFPLVSDFYLHGKAGIIDIQEQLIPTFWYNKWHPFEFEFVVNDKIGQQKIFTDLIIISNKAEPESFHFEIEGDNYEFSSDKRNMYFRQEATKELYQNLGSNMLFDRGFIDVAADKYTQEQYYRKRGEEYINLYKKIDKVYPIESQNLVQQVKSTIFPLYYERIDTYDDIYHRYREMTGGDLYDFKNLSGSEILWDRDQNQFNIVTHIKNNPIDLVGRLRGNSRYKEGKWNIQIPSIAFMQKNEGIWEKPSSSEINYFKLDYDCPCSLTPLAGRSDNQKESNIVFPPLVINSQYIPNDLTTNEISSDRLPNIYSKYGYNIGAIEVDGWTCRKETKIRDKWIKIRVRYSGRNLAVIHSLITLYNISYS